MSDQNPTKKSSLRSALRQQRRELDAPAQQRAAQQLAHNIQIHHWYQEATTIAAYLPNDGEISLLPLFDHAFAQGKRICLPKVAGKEMAFYEFRDGDALETNRFGIKEPSQDADFISRQDLELVLVPLVGFDATGNRLGMGGGYYDRYFQKPEEQQRRHASQDNTSRDNTSHDNASQSNASATKLIGIAHSFQQLDLVEADAWDIALHAIITDSFTIECKPE